MTTDCHTMSVMYVVDGHTMSVMYVWKIATMLSRIYGMATPVCHVCMGWPTEVTVYVGDGHTTSLSVMYVEDGYISCLSLMYVRDGHTMSVMYV